MKQHFAVGEFNRCFHISPIQGGPEQVTYASSGSIIVRDLKKSTSQYALGLQFVKYYLVGSNVVALFYRDIALIPANTTWRAPARDVCRAHRW